MHLQGYALGCRLIPRRCLWVAREVFASLCFFWYPMCQRPLSLGNKFNGFNGSTSHRWRTPRVATSRGLRCIHTAALCGVACRPLASFVPIISGRADPQRSETIWRFLAYGGKKPGIFYSPAHEGFGAG